MFTWKECYKWHFDDAGMSSTDKGPAITGSSIFRGGHFKNVIRETVQNSTDAKDDNLPDDVPVEVHVDYLEIDRDEVPGVDCLKETIDLCYGFITRREEIKKDDIELLYQASHRHFVGAQKIPVLKISDYNTHGLTSRDYDSLLKLDGLTYKSDGTTSGSFGFGKFAPYLLSPVNTVLYVSKNLAGEYFMTGRTFLSTFADPDGRNKKVGESQFGSADLENFCIAPIRNPDDVPEVFRRDKTGTDLYILCFEREEDWMDQMVFCALENYFYSVYSKRVSFFFSDGDRTESIEKNNLGDMIAKYENIYNTLYASETAEFAFHAPMYWKVLTDERTVPFPDPDFRGKGEVLLYILMGEDIKGRTVLEMRKSGMKIQEDTGFNRVANFNGIFIATGAGRDTEDYHKNISKFLNKMESPSHTSWSVEDVKDPADKPEAKRIIAGIHEWIRECVKSQMPEDDGTPIDVFGLNRILPNVAAPGNNIIEESAARQFTPKPLESVTGRNRGHIPPIIEPTNGRGHRPDPNPRPTPDPNRVIRPRNNRQRKKIVGDPVSISAVRAPYDSAAGVYHLSFVSSRTVDTLMLEIGISGDDGSVFDPSITEAYSGGNRLALKDGLVLITNVRADNKTSCDISLSDHEPYALEVKAYVKK